MSVSSFSQWLQDNAEKCGTRDALVKLAVRRKKGTRPQAQKRISDLVRQGKISPEFGGARMQKTLKTIESHESEGPEDSLVSAPATKRKAIKVPSKFRMGIDVSVVKQEYDYEGKIEKGLENLGTQVIKDNDFRMELVISVDRWKIASGLKKFERNRIELKGKQFKGVYWGSVDVVRELRKAVDMV